MIIDIFGYLALGFGLFAITKKEMTKFRLWHLGSAISYIIYGVLISAYPVIISGSLFVSIHFFHLIRKTTYEDLNRR